MKKLLLILGMIMLMTIGVASAITVTKTLWDAQTTDSCGGNPQWQNCGNSNDNNTDSYARIESDGVNPVNQYFILPPYNITNVTVYAKTSYQGFTNLQFSSNGYISEQVYNYSSNAWNTLKYETIINTTDFIGTDSFSLSNDEWGVDNKIDFKLDETCFSKPVSPSITVYYPISLYETWVEYTYNIPVCDESLTVFPCAPPSSFNFTNNSVAVKFHQSFGDLFSSEINNNGDDWVAINSSSVANVPATIIFSNVDNSSYVPYRNGVICNATYCSNINNDGSTLSFDVIGWSNYTYGAGIAEPDFALGAPIGSTSGSANAPLAREAEVKKEATPEGTPLSPGTKKALSFAVLAFVAYMFLNNDSAVSLSSRKGRGRKRRK